MYPNKMIISQVSENSELFAGYLDRQPSRTGLHGYILNPSPHEWGLLRLQKDEGYSRFLYVLTRVNMRLPT